MLWRCCSNVEATSWQRWRATLSQRRKLTSVQLSFSTVPQRCDNVNNDVVTMLSQRRCASWEVINVRHNYIRKVLFLNLFIWCLKMLLLIPCWIIHRSASLKARISAAKSYTNKYSLSLLWFSLSSYSSFSILFSIVIRFWSTNNSYCFFFFISFWFWVLHFFLAVLNKFASLGQIHASFSVISVKVFFMTPSSSSSGMLLFVFLGLR